MSLFSAAQTLWKEAVVQAASVNVCTAENWATTWPDTDGKHKDFDVKHLATAAFTEDGAVVVKIPSRGTYRPAGVKGHFMEYIYLTDETSDVIAVHKYDYSDDAGLGMEGHTFPADVIGSATEVTPFSIDCIHGVWQGDTVVRAGGDDLVKEAL